MLEELENYSENNRLEAKAARGGLPKSIWETYSAFANTAGGVILLGVEELEDHSLHPVGVKDPRKLLDDFWNTVNDSQRVSARVLDDSNVSVEEIDGKKVIQIHVPRADRRVKPVYLHDNPSHAYRRDHTGDYRCTMDEIRSMMRDASEESQDAKPLPGVRMDELCQETINGYREIYRQVHPNHPWNKKPDDEFLRLIGAAAEADDGKLHPTGAGLLMFGEDWRISEVFPHYFLDYRQQTSPRERWQDRVISQGGDWSGNVIDFYQRVYSLAKQALKTPFRLVGDRRDDDTPAHKALREALANCPTNANYHERQGVVVLWEPDKITVANPGDFRISMERALMGGKSDPRNENMLKIFSYIEVGERAGSGVPAIVDNWKECGYDAPRWDEEFGPDRTMLTLPLTAVERENRNELMHGMGGYVPLDIFASLDDNQKTAVKMAARDGKVTTKALADAAGISSKSASQTLKGLVKREILVWHGRSTRDPRQYYDLPAGPSE